MRNNKGFTWVEFLAMMVVLGILMAVTVPNITGIISSHRINISKTDGRKMADRAKIKVSKDNLPKPKNGECIILSLNYLNDNDDIISGPNGGKYLQFDSFVIYKREGSKYKCYVRLVEENGEEHFGIELSDVEEIVDSRDDNIVVINDLVGLTKENASSHLSMLQGNSRVTSICPSSKIIGYYPGNLKSFEEIKTDG